jgi:transposase
MVRPSVGQKEDRRLRRENAELQARIAEFQQSNAELESRLDELEAELEAAQRELDLRARQQRTIRDLEREIARLRERLQQYEPETSQVSQCDCDQQDVGQPADASQYSLAAEEKRRSRKKRGKNKKGRGGRKSTDEKFKRAGRFENIYPDGCSPEECEPAGKRVVWRLIDGRAVLVAYRLFRKAGGREVAQPTNVLPRGEYDVLFLVTLAFLVFVTRISMDKACELVRFFWELPLQKSQADAMLNQLSRHWETEFDSLCELIATALVVYMDETGWKVGRDRNSLWAFMNKLHCVFQFGCRKDAATLERMLPSGVFQGIGVSDNAAVYGKFRRAQKCWAHLLRKAIKLSLLYPENEQYRQFLDELLDIYRTAKRISQDRRYSRAGRASKVTELADRICDLCLPWWMDSTEGLFPPDKTLVNLAGELMQLMLRRELFTFVTEPGVEGTNNVSERTIRPSTQDRDTGRTSKTPRGARRRSIITSVLESLRLNLETFSLSSVVAEVTRWFREGTSLFAQQLKKRKRELQGRETLEPG